jgi:hypothetical protein
MPSHIDIFTTIYETCAWGDNRHDKYKGTSGGGSDVAFNIDSYIPCLKNFIQIHAIQSVVDLGCGDFRCGSILYDVIDVKYHGYDAYSKVIEHNRETHSADKYTFTHMDIYNQKEDIVGGDLCILKDILQHWTLEEIYVFMDYLTTCKKFKYILICNCCNQTSDNPSNEGRSVPLSIAYLPLKKYSPHLLLNYNSKEVSFIVV